MSELNDWDQEFAIIAREVNTLVTDHLKNRVSRNKGLVTRKMATIQSQLKIEKMLKRIRSFCEREFLLLPKEKALVHWSEVFLHRVENYYELKQKNLTRALWLKLIRTRISGPDKAAFTNFDNDDLITLSLRHAALLKTEKFLGDAIVRKRRQKKEAIARYQELTIAQENRTSAASMQSRLGSDLDHAMRNPIVTALGRALIELSASLHRETKKRQLTELELKYSRRTQSVMEICQKFAVNSHQDPDWNLPPRLMDRVGRTLRKLGELEEATRNSYNELLSGEFPAIHPKIVQNTQKKDRTISPEKS